MTRRKHHDVWRERQIWIPRTPAGTECDWLASRSEDEAWTKLMRDAAHMPYEDKAAFIARGYTVNLWTAEAKKK